MGSQEGRTAGVSGSKIFAGVTVAIVVATVGYALWLAGSPAKERSKRLDAQRVSDLQNIASSVDGYYARQTKVPATLDLLKSDVNNYFNGRLTDPVTEQPYEYRTTSDIGYELCATFELPSEPIKPGKSSPYGYYGKEWEHAAGRVCFELDSPVRQPRSACALTSPCAAGQNCVTLDDGQGSVCVPAGKECLAAGCDSGKCTIGESYPAKVRCAE